MYPICQKNFEFMTTLLGLPSMSSVETIIDSNSCTRVIFGGLTKTLLEAPSEAAAALAVQQLRITEHQAKYYYSDKHNAWHVTVYH